MTVVSRTHQLSEDELATLRQPRRDLLHEHPDGDDRWRQDRGPFRVYERSLSVEPVDHSTYKVDERTEFKLAIPVWGGIFVPLMKRALVDTDRQPRPRWWWPQELIDSQATTILAVVAVISVAAGYLGVLIGQTITFAAEEFGANDADQGRTLAAIRIGIVVSVLFIRRADKVGRRPLLIGFAASSIVITALGALAPNLFTLGLTQAVARGLATGLLTLITLAVTEEVPAEVRSMTIGLVTLSTGFGGGLVVMALSLADISEGAWRLLYVLPLLFLPVILWAWRSLPETRRFDAAAVVDTAPVHVDRRRFWLLAFTSFGSTIFLSPASQLLNEYLNDELGFSAARISLFRLTINLPIALFILGAGFLADRTGRRPVGSIGIAFGASASALMFYSTGLWLWISAMVGTWMLAGAYTALRSYQTELFPTKARARVGGWLDLVAVSGSAAGLLIAGELAERWGSLGPSIAVLLVGPLLVLVSVIVFYPETAKAELEDFNPGDPKVR